MYPEERRRYEEVRNLYIEQLTVLWTGESTKETARAGVEAKIKSFANGELGHATEMLSALWEFANNSDGVAPPSKALPMVSPSLFRSCRLLSGALYTMVPGRMEEVSRTFGACVCGALQVDSQWYLL